MENILKNIFDFFEYCKYQKSLSCKTLEAYTIDLTQFCTFLSEHFSIADISGIDKEMLRFYLQLLNEKYKIKSIKRKVACLKVFFSYLEFEDIILVNPFRKLKIKLKEPFRLPIVMTLSEVEKIIIGAYKNLIEAENKEGYKYKSTIRDIAILELLFATGLRVSELCNLKKNDISIESGYIKVNGKGSKQRIIYIGNIEVIEILIQYRNYFKEQIDDKEYFFINRLGNRLSEQSVRYMVQKYAEESNMNKHITPHVFRHSFATLLLEEGVDIKYIQNFLGHSSIMTTQIYTHVTKKKQKEILETKHPRKNIHIKQDVNKG